MIGSIMEQRLLPARNGFFTTMARPFAAHQRPRRLT
jgi:hypothetical protein